MPPKTKGPATTAPKKAPGPATTARKAGARTIKKAKKVKRIGLRRTKGVCSLLQTRICRLLVDSGCFKEAQGALARKALHGTFCTN